MTKFKYDIFSPTELDIKKNPHFQNLLKCWQTQCGTYHILYSCIGKYIHLRIQRIDNKPVHNYMDFQQIKNDLLGEDVIAIEIYPKKSDFKNGSHTYHLWTWEGIETPNLADFPKYI